MEIKPLVEQVEKRTEENHLAQNLQWKLYVMKPKLRSLYPTEL